LSFFHGHLDFPYRVAWKTGTSNGYRDSWICGYTPEYTVGVWAGNFQGDATYHLSGSEGAGGIFADAVKELYQGSNPGIFERPPGIVQAEVCSHSGMSPCAACPSKTQEWFVAGTVPTRLCSFHQGDTLLHEIPTQYAGWLQDQERKGIDSPYVLPEATKPRVGLHSIPETVSNIRISESAQEQIVRIGTNPAKRFVQPDFQKDELQILYPLDNDRFLLEPTLSDSGPTC
jgi:membrane carboxypeptidase/penicillin-binding protein PbpC